MTDIDIGKIMQALAIILSRLAGPSDLAEDLGRRGTELASPESNFFGSPIIRKPMWDDQKEDG